MSIEFQEFTDEMKEHLQEGLSLYEQTPSPEEMRKIILRHLEKTEKGAVKRSRINVSKIIEEDPALHGTFRFNKLTQRCDVVKNVPWVREGNSTAFNDNDFRNVCYYIEKYYVSMPDKLVEETIHRLAVDNAYHPIQDHLNVLVWDGTPRLPYLLHHFLGAPVNEYTEEITRVFLLGAVTRVFKPGTKFDYLLCLYGGQGIGKSSFCRLLALKDEWFTDDMRDLENEKVYQKLQGHWIVELSEMLATNNAKSIEVTKSFISRQNDIYRTPYEKYPQDRPRQVVFIGTTNKRAFLPLDRTGNRRFLPVECHPEDAEVSILEDEAASREYIDQVWAEVMEIYRSGEYRLVLSAANAEKLKTIQEEFLSEDTDLGMIQAFMEETAEEKVCSKMLYEDALNKLGEPTKRDTDAICETVNQLIRDGRLPQWRRFDGPRRFSRYGKQRGWERIPVEGPTGFEEITVPMDNPFEKES